MTAAKKKKMETPRIVAETDEETRKEFAAKVHREGYTIKGLILRWVNEYLSGKKR